MLIDKPEYHRNSKTGNIVRRQKVEVQCDSCEAHWKTEYGNYQRKKNEQDLCASCRMKANWMKGRNAPAFETFACANCNKEFRRSLNRTDSFDNPCCSTKCRSEFNAKQRYGHLQESFSAHPNKAAYLVGLILGDGHLKKTQKLTTRVSVAFDATRPELIDIALEAMDRLKIDHYTEPSVRTNCVMVGFTLPDSLLEKLGMLFSGAKYDNQDKMNPPDEIVENINFAAGLINSDGHVGKFRTGRPFIGFINTAKKISSLLEQSLESNGIEFGHYEYDPPRDKRTGKINKKNFRTVIGKIASFEKYRDMIHLGGKHAIG